MSTALLIFFILTLMLHGESKHSLIERSNLAVHLNELALHDLWEGSYKWQSSNVLYYLTSADGKWNANIILTDSGKTYSFDQFNRTVRATQMSSVFRWAISSDGRKLIWTSGTDEHPTWALTDLRSPAIQYKTRTRATDSYCIWTPDNNKWIEYAANQSDAYCVLHNPNRLELRPVRIMMPASATFLGGTNRDTILSFRSAQSEPYDIELVETDISSNTTTHRIVGPGYKVRQAILAPDGSKIVWTFTYHYEDPLNKILNTIKCLKSDPPVDRVEVKPFRIEGSADPGEHFIVLRVFRIVDGLQEVQIPRCAADIIGGRGTLPRDTQWIEPLCVGFIDELNLDEMAPTVAEVVFVDELAKRVAQSSFERVFLFVQHIQLLQMSGSVSGAEGLFAELEAVQMGVGPPHHELQQIVQLR